jgi:hypothetical protein
LVSVPPGDGVTLVLSRIFPKQFDNNYRGHWLAISLIVPVMLLEAAQDVIVIWSTRTTLITADAIPLDSYGTAGAQAVISLSAIMALTSLVIPLQSVVVLIRYRAMIPFMYFCLLILDVGNRVLAQVNPIVRADAHAIAQAHPSGFYIPHSGYYVGLFVLAMTFVGFVLSLRNKANAPKRPLAENARS